MDARRAGPGWAPSALLPVALGLLLGVAARVTLDAGAWPWLAGAVLASGFCIRRLRWLGAGTLVGLVGAAASAATEASSTRVLALPGWYEVTGLVRSIAAPRPTYSRFVLDVDALGSEPSPWCVDEPIRVTLWRGGPGRRTLPALQPSARVRCLLWIRAPTLPLAGSSGGRRYLRGRLPDARALERLPPAAGVAGEMASLRRRAAACFGRHLAPPDAGLARALLLGDKSELHWDDRSTFRAAGQAHLLAVSGIHVGLLLAGVIWVARHIGFGLRATWLLGLLVAVLYVPFTGAPPSAVRAGCGAALYFVGRLLDRPPRGLAVLTLVGAALLLARPLSLSNLSFQLSFAAVIGILTLGPRLFAWMVPDTPAIPGVPRRKALVRGALCVALSAWLATAPIVALEIGRLCPLGALISLPALPLAALALGSGFLMLLTAPIPAVADLAAHAFASTTHALRGLLSLTSNAGLDARPVAAPGAVWLLAYALAFALAVRGTGRKATVAVLALPVLLSALFVVGVGPPTDGTQPLDPNEYHARAAPMPNPVFPNALAEPAGLALLAGGLVLFGLLSVRPLRWLTAGGATAATALGIAAGWRFGWAGLAAVFTPFTIATLLSKLPGPGRSGARRLRQVVCNGFPALVGCGLAVLGRPGEGLAFFLGALACLGSDTTATEIGMRYGGRVWRLIGREPIERGESGGVTNLGQLAAFAGGMLAPGAYALVAGAPLAYVGALTAAGVAGSLLDSALGGTLQYRGIDPATGDIVEAHEVGGNATRPYSGIRWLTNDAVNLVSGIAAGAIAVALTGLL